MEIEKLIKSIKKKERKSIKESAKASREASEYYYDGKAEAYADILNLLRVMKNEKN